MTDGNTDIDLDRFVDVIKALSTDAIACITQKHLATLQTLARGVIAQPRVPLATRITERMNRKISHTNNPTVTTTGRLCEVADIFTVGSKHICVWISDSTYHLTRRVQGLCLSFREKIKVAMTEVDQAAMLQSNAQNAVQAYTAPSTSD